MGFQSSPSNKISKMKNLCIMTRIISLIFAIICIFKLIDANGYSSGGRGGSLYRSGNAMGSASNRYYHGSNYKRRSQKPSSPIQVESPTPVSQSQTTMNPVVNIYGRTMTVTGTSGDTQTITVFSTITEQTNVNSNYQVLNTGIFVVFTTQIDVAPEAPSLVNTTLFTGCNDAFFHPMPWWCGNNWYFSAITISFTFGLVLCTFAI